RVKFLPFNDWIKSAAFISPNLFGTNISLKFDTFVNPGIFPFIPIALFCVPFFGMNKKQTHVAWKGALTGIRGPLIALIFAVALVQIMIQSGTNTNQYPSMLIAMAESMAMIFQKTWPLVDSFIGVAGSFMAGSNTVSNMLFSYFHYSIADTMGISRIIA